MKALAKRLDALEGAGGQMVIVELPHGGNAHAMIEGAGVRVGKRDLVVVINKPEGCGGDGFVRTVKGAGL